MMQDYQPGKFGCGRDQQVWHRRRAMVAPASEDPLHLDCARPMAGVAFSTDIRVSGGAVTEAVQSSLDLVE